LAELWWGGPIENKNISNMVYMKWGGVEERGVAGEREKCKGAEKGSQVFIRAIISKKKTQKRWEK